ncbi:proline-rich domain-containing protein [Nocardiopsis chromatogenes]|uniref:proline-rich domain-containing protein n=1 Tax=Nocardiopsis chromatogenes TaxID=280239 RepID=UPI00034953CA|nr:proline-rich domain-containing protein [Nocardiopsis chromatogenes]
MHGQRPHPGQPHSAPPYNGAYPPHYGSPYGASPQPPVPGRLKAARVVIFILASLTSVGALACGLLFFFESSSPSTAQGDYWAGMFLMLAVVLAAWAVWQFVLGAKATTRRPWVMWAIIVTYGLSAASGVLNFFLSIGTGESTGGQLLGAGLAVSIAIATWIHRDYYTGRF